jgi:toxin HigB-1
MIDSFKDKDTERLWRAGTCRRWKQIEAIALKRLAMLAAATQLSDLRVPPGNRLEALAGDRVGQHSIRINDQWRLCFRWTPAGVQDVEIVDYH